MVRIVVIQATAAIGSPKRAQQPSQSDQREKEDRRERPEPVMAQRHVKEIEAIRLAHDSPSRGLLGIEPGKVEGVKLQRRFPQTALPEIRFGAEFRVNQLQLAQGRILGRHRRGDWYAGPREPDRAAFAWGNRKSSNPDTRARNDSAGSSLTSVNAAQNPTAANRHPDSLPSSQIRKKW